MTIISVKSLHIIGPKEGIYQPVVCKAFNALQIFFIEFSFFLLHIGIWDKSSTRSWVKLWKGIAYALYGNSLQSQGPVILEKSASLHQNRTWQLWLNQKATLTTNEHCLHVFNDSLHLEYFNKLFTSEHEKLKHESNLICFSQTFRMSWKQQNIKFILGYVTWVLMKQNNNSVAQQSYLGKPMTANVMIL